MTLGAGAPDLTDAGIVVSVAVILLTARLVFEQTILSFHRGQSPAQSWPVFAGPGKFAFGAAFLWIAAVLIWWRSCPHALTRLDRGLMIVIVVCALICAVPGEGWALAMARVGGAQRAPAEWVAASAVRGEIRLLGYLLAHGANANSRTDNGQSALAAAAATGQVAACELLLADGARIDARDALTGQTPLIAAAQEDRADAVRLLIARGADRTVRDDAGLTAEDWAVINGDRRVRELVTISRVADAHRRL